MTTGGVLRSTASAAITVFAAGVMAMVHFYPLNVFCFGGCCFLTGVTFTSAYLQCPATPAELKDLGVKG